jgi:hypothetical protein
MGKAYRRVCLLGSAILIIALGAPVFGQYEARDGIRYIPGGTDVIGSVTTNTIIREWRGRGRFDCQVHTLKYIPVCARTHNYLVATYSNRCMALADGATPITDDGEPCPQAECHTLYQPVCARLNSSQSDVSLDRPVIRAFINRCIAEKYQNPDNPDVTATVIRSYGEDIYMYSRPRNRPQHVDDDDFSRICPRENSCPDRPEYVCAKDRNNKARIYRNKCFAVLEGAKFSHYMQPPRQPYFSKCE